QLATHVNAIATTGAGSFVRELYTGMPPWRADHQRWYAVDLAALGDNIYGYELAARPGHMPWILGERTDGGGIVARWRGAGFSRLALPERVSRGAVPIGDDLWALHDKKIWRFDREWIEAGAYDGELGYRLRPIDDAGLVILEGEHPELARVVV